MVNIFSLFTKRAKSFCTDNSGSIMVYVSLAVIPIIGFIGVAIDSARGYMVRSHLVESLDAAALAAGRSLTQEAIQTDVTRFFELNFKDNYMGAALIGPTATYNPDDNTIIVTASAEINTTFMGIFGHETLNISSSTTITRDTRGMELVLIMDNTGSMQHNDKLETMKSSAQNLIEILYGEEETLDDFWVSVVPYSASVNIGNENFDWLQNYDPSAYNPTVWKGCVEAREAPYDQDDTVPNDQLFDPYFYPFSIYDNYWITVREGFDWGYYQRGPNKSCGQAIQPLTANRSDIDGALEDMVYWNGGGTLGNLGLVWGWRTISPKWRGLWQGTDVSLPLDYNTKQMDKVAIMLTDGVNQFVPGWVDGSDYTAYGRIGWERLGTSSTSEGADIIDGRLSTVCEAMKEEGIILYTITFQLSDEDTQDLYRNCATSENHYFNSPSNDELRETFIRIGTALSNLRISN